MATTDNFHKNIDTKSQEAQRYFLGHAKVQLFQLSGLFDSEDGVHWYLQRFKQEECSRLDPEHFVTVLTTKDQINQAVAQSNLDPDKLFSSNDPPFLLLQKDTALPCLRGRDLLEAARRFLPPGQKWWIAKLYSDGEHFGYSSGVEGLTKLPHYQELPIHLQDHLRSQYSIEEKVSDFTVFCDLLLNHAPHSAQAWRNRFESETDFHYVKKVDGNLPLRRALQSLAPFRGLWERFTFRKLEYILAPLCDEVESSPVLGKSVTDHEQVMVHYLHRIHTLWSTLFPGDMASLVDPKSVDLIEGLMPNYSLIDRDKIVRTMHTSYDNPLFPRLVHPERRDQVLQGLLSIPGRILSLSTFFQDTILLSGPARAIRNISGLKPRGSIQDFLFNNWSGWNGSCCIEVSENQYEEISLEPMIGRDKAEETAALISLLQLWLVAFRHFIDPRKGRGTNLDGIKPVFEVRGKPELANAAHRLGFILSKSQPNTNRDSNISVFQYLSTTLDQEAAAKLDNQRLVFVARKFQEFMKAARAKAISPKVPELGEDSKLRQPNRRAGRPLQREYLEYRRFFFLRYIYCQDQQAKQHPSSFAIIRDIFFSFFGRHSLINSMFADKSTQPMSQEMPTELLASQIVTQITPVPEALQSLPPESPLATSQAMQPQKDADCISSPVELNSHPPTPSALPMDGVEKIVPLAPGFENDLCRAPMCTKTPITIHDSMKEIFVTWYQSKQSDVVVFYLFSSREYYKFFADDAQNIRAHIVELALNHYFLRIDKDELNVVETNHAFTNVVETKLLLVGTRSMPGELEGRNEGLSHQEVEEYISRYNIFTGKRYITNEFEEHSKRKQRR